MITLTVTVTLTLKVGAFTQNSAKENLQKTLQSIMLPDSLEK
jgi:hypothetical protein